MLICKKPPFVFVHIPKTAGTSINYCFSGHTRIIHPLYHPRTQHESYSEFISRMKSAKNDNHPFINAEEYFFFSFVRNPFSRVVSLYRYMKTRHDENGKYPDMPGDFDHFLQHIKDRKPWIEDLHFIFRPQCDFVTDGEGKLAVDFVGKYESLQDDLSTLCSTLKISPSYPLQEINSTGPRVDYREFYSDESRKIVEDVYQGDLEMFDYNY